MYKKREQERKELLSVITQPILTRKGKRAAFYAQQKRYTFFMVVLVKLLLLKRRKKCDSLRTNYFLISLGNK